MDVFGPLDHGTVVERQAAFLRGFYGGPDFCSGTLKSPSPRIGGTVLESQSLLQPQFGTGSKQNCRVSPSAAGISVQNDGAHGDCVINLLPANTVLPDHVRIELSVTLLPNRVRGGTSTAGIYYGDSRATSGLIRFGYAPQSSTDAKVTNINGRPQVEEPDLKGSSYVEPFLTPRTDRNTSL